MANLLNAEQRVRHADLQERFGKLTPDEREEFNRLSALADYRGVALGDR